MNNLDKAKKLINEKKFEVNRITCEGNKTQLHINTRHAFEAAEIAATPNWKYPEKNEFPERDGIILAFSKSKQIVKPISYINDAGTKSWLKLNFESWCELPVFNKA